MKVISILLSLLQTFNVENFRLLYTVLFQFIASIISSNYVDTQYMTHGHSSVLPTVRNEDFDKERVKRLNILVTRETISTTGTVGPKYDFKV
jgi:hypothetical protein